MAKEVDLNLFVLEYLLYIVCYIFCSGEHLFSRIRYFRARDQVTSRTKLGTECTIQVELDSYLVPCMPWTQLSYSFALQLITPQWCRLKLKLHLFHFLWICCWFVVQLFDLLCSFSTCCGQVESHTPLIRSVVDFCWVHNKSTTSRHSRCCEYNISTFEMLWVCCGPVEKLWICCGFAVDLL
jgi:hypothetical protein